MIEYNSKIKNLVRKDNKESAKLIIYSGIFTPDGKQFYFTSNRINSTQDLNSDDFEYTINHDIWVVDVSYKKNSFQFSNLKNANELMTTNNISEFNKINTSMNEGSVYFTPDGNFMYFTACNRPNGKGNCDIFVSKKIDGKWSEAISLNKNINSNYFDSDPFISFDSNKLLFISNRKSDKQDSSNINVFQNDKKYNIYESDYDITNKSWKNAKLIEDIVSDFSDRSPYMNNKADTLFFSSNRFTKGEYYQLVFSTFDTKSQKWNKPKLYKGLENKFYNVMNFKYSYDNKYIIINNYSIDNTLNHNKLLFNSTRDWIKKFDSKSCDSLNIQIYKNE